MFETNTKSHEHRSIWLFISEQDTIVKPKKTKVAFNQETAQSPEIQSYRMW